MFEIAILLGIYAYIIFGLGLLGILYTPVIWLFTALFIGVTIVYYRKCIGNIRDFRIVWSNWKKKANIISLLLLVILFIQIFVNFLGALGPELGFDALWYHLTIPKIYLSHHAIFYIPGGLFYYSTMPKLLELLYIGGLSFGSEVFPKLMQFACGVGILIVLYRISRKFISISMSLLVLIIFYANLVVGWESISAYIDLGRTFFELLAVFAFLLWLEKKEKKWFVYSAICIGLAITTKLLALGSLVILCVLISIVLWKKRARLYKTLIAFVAIALCIPLPWFVFSFIYTGNPVYPFFSHIYPVPFPLQLFNPWYFVTSFWNLFLFSPDPINPFYLITLPLLLMFFKKWPFPIKLMFFYTLGGLLLWYITPQTGGGRFILPYLPILSLLSVMATLSLSQKWLKQLLFAIAMLIALSSIGYRSIANAKFVPVIIGKESSAHFLAKYLNFSFGDFVDTDGYFRKHIKPTDTVLLYGFHNEYYVDFPFIDATWVQKGDAFDYIAVQNGRLPKRFATWILMYANPITHVALYTDGRIPWTY